MLGKPSLLARLCGLREVHASDVDCFVASAPRNDGTLDVMPPGDDSGVQTLTGPIASKCPRRCSHASRIRLGTATSTQIAKNIGHPTAFAT